MLVFGPVHTQSLAITSRPNSLFYVAYPFPSVSSPHLFIQRLALSCTLDVRIYCGNISESISMHTVSDRGWDVWSGEPQVCQLDSTTTWHVSCAGIPNTMSRVSTSNPSIGCPAFSTISTTATDCSAIATTFVPVPGDPIVAWITDGNQSLLWDSNSSHGDLRLVQSIAHRTRTSPSQLYWTVFPTSPFCLPQRVPVIIPVDCVGVMPFRLDWTDQSPIPLIVCWCATLMIYLFGILSRMWSDYPRLGIMMQSLMMAEHMPIMYTVTFTGYVTATCIAASVPLVYTLYRAGWVLLQPPATFRLPKARSIEGVGRFCLFLFCFGLTIVVAVGLGR